MSDVPMDTSDRACSKKWGLFNAAYASNGDI